MQSLAKLACLSAIAVAVAIGSSIGACADDTANVRVRPEGGTPIDGGQVQFLACGVAVPSTYDAPSFATNAKEEIDLGARFVDLQARMSAAEGAGTSIVTAGDLRAIYEQGTPSLKNASTSTAQAILDGYFTQFGDAAGKTWTPEQVDADGGGVTGGKYANDAIMSPVGLDLREAAAKMILGGALYNHALVLASGPITEAAVDRFVAIFGASTKVANTTDPDAGPDQDRLIAEYASKRDDRSKDNGLYRRMKFEILAMKAAAIAGEKCKDDLDAASKVFLAQWEKVTYASAIYYLNDAAAKALATPPNGPAALHSFGEAIGFITSFKGIAPDRRKITDVQIDALLTSIGDTTAYQLALPATTSDRVAKLTAAIKTIADIYEFAPSDVESFEKVF